MDNSSTGEIGIISTIASIHDWVTMVIGSGADVSGIALAFHIDDWMLRSVILFVAFHITVGLSLKTTKLVIKHRQPKRHRSPIGFVPPKH